MYIIIYISTVIPILIRIKAHVNPALCLYNEISAHKFATKVSPAAYTLTFR